MPCGGICNRRKRRDPVKTTERYRNFNFDAFINAPKVKDFIGNNYEHYRDLWTADYAKHGKPERIMTSMHFNLLALLMPPAWFGYRKMWVVLWSWLGLICGMTVLDEIFNADIPAASWTVANVVVAILCKGAYFDHVVKFFETNKNLPGPALERAIQRQGGTSVGMAFLACFISLIVILAVEVACYHYTNTLNAVIVDTDVKTG